MRLEFKPLRAMGWVEHGGVRWKLTHPEDRPREIGRGYVRDCFHLHPDDFDEGPGPGPHPTRCHDIAADGRVCLLDRGHRCKHCDGEREWLGALPQIGRHP